MSRRCELDFYRGCQKKGGMDVFALIGSSFRLMWSRTPDGFLGADDVGQSH